MPTLIATPTSIQAAGNKPKLIDEYIGRVNSKTSSTSVAHMRSPQGWLEPGQTPEFDEFTIVLKGMLRVEHKEGGLASGNREYLRMHRGKHAFDICAAPFGTAGNSTRLAISPSSGKRWLTRRATPSAPILTQTIADGSP